MKPQRRQDLSIQLARSIDIKEPNAIWLILGDMPGDEPLVYPAAWNFISPIELKIRRLR